MVVFSFVNSGDGGYCIASGQATMKWRGLPYDLESEMEGVKQKGEEVKGLSVGRNGDWFLRTNTRYACKTEHIRGDWTSNVERFAQLVQKAGFSLADYLIQFFTFVPDPTGYVAVLRKTDGSLTQCSWHNIPQKLDKLLEREGPKGVRHVTVGVNGSYVVIMNSGAMWWSGVPVRLKQLLEDAERMKRPVATVSLSLISPSRYFVEFADGSTKFILPEDWHNSVNSCSQAAPVKRVQVTGLRMTTSYNSGSHSPPHDYPQHAQFGSSDAVGTSPASPLNSDPVSSYGGGSGAHSLPQHAQFGLSNPVSSSPASDVSYGHVNSYGGSSGVHSRSYSYPQHAQFGSSNPIGIGPAGSISPSAVSSGPDSLYGGGSAALSHPQHLQFGSSNPVSVSPASLVRSGVSLYGGGSGALSHPQQVQFGSPTPVRSNPVHPVSSYDGSATPAPAYTSNLYITSVSTGLPQKPVHNVTQLDDSSMPLPQQQPEPKPQQEPKQQQEQQEPKQQQQWQQQGASTLQKYDGTFKLAGADS